MMPTKAAVVPMNSLKLKIKIPTTSRVEAEPRVEISGYVKQFSAPGKLLVNGSENSRMKPCRASTKKRPAPKESEECQNAKRPKLDSNLKRQCLSVLNKMMTHRSGWAFLRPVDPMALNIPDYFDIISQPMDFGTIKTKLEKNLYLSIEEFAADVRLTFSNAMLYNPSSNFAYVAAEKLNILFDTMWKSVEAKTSRESLKVGLEHISSERTKETLDLRKGHCQIPTMGNNTLKKSMTSDETQRPRKAVEILEEKMAPQLHVTLQNKFSKSTEKSIHKDSPAEKAVIKVNNPTIPAKSTSDLNLSRSDPDSDGVVSGLDEENICSLSTDGASPNGWDAPVFEVQLSPKKALRAAMLKSRFADTIVKAQQRSLLSHGDKLDPVRMQREKERLKKKQLEEKARIEAEIKAAEAASLLKAQTELKLQRERQREAARIALQMMEKTVDIEDNLEILKDLATLSGRTASGYLFSSRGRSDEVFSAVEEQLGLFIKDDYLVDEDDNDNAEIFIEEQEEGEIFS